MAELVSGNAAIGQSGGPTAVINQSLAGVIEGLKAGLAASGNVKRILGMRHGVRGIVKAGGEGLVDLTSIPADKLERLARTPSAALGSTRDKPDEAYCQKILEGCRGNDIRYFFYIGGNDSADTCRIVSEKAAAAGYDLRCFHVPKTIDNDLAVTDHCPGYGSAARFVAQAFLGDNQDNRSLPGIKIDVIMGRHAGWLTAASSLARVEADDGPHLIYVPERNFDLDRFAADVDRVYRQHGRCLIAVSEGVHGSDGSPIMTSGERDSHGNVQLSGSGALGDFLAEAVKSRLKGKLRVRADTFGYLQRSFMGVVSPVDAAEARMRVTISSVRPT